LSRPVTGGLPLSHQRGLGTLSHAKIYLGAKWVQDQSRVTNEPDYGRRGMFSVHGALEPTRGKATFTLSAKRDRASHIQLLEIVIQTFPTLHLLMIEDNLSVHHSRNTRIDLAA
jgi:hypothetical protein